MRINSTAILKALPIQGMESEWLASIDLGLETEAESWGRPVVKLCEPPAGGTRIPYVAAVGTICLILRHLGASPEVAQSTAVDLYEGWRDELSVYRRPVLYGPETGEALKPPEYVPVDALVAMLCAREVGPNALLDYLNSAAVEVARAPRYELNWPPTGRLSILELPELPTPQRMIEFFVGLPCDLGWELYPENDDWPCKEFDDWRNSMRNVASELEADLGEQVYHFADPGCETDDDYCHRFLALHCYCTLLPQSTFVAFLLEVAKVESVEILKSGLIDASNYAHPFEMNEIWPFELPTRDFHYPFMAEDTPHGHTS